MIVVGIVAQYGKTRKPAAQEQWNIRLKMTQNLKNSLGKVSLSNSKVEEIFEISDF